MAAILNGLGSTKYEELFLLWGIVSRLLREQDLEIVVPEVGELVTSLDMGGVSLTLCWLDDELEPLWLDPADTPAWKRESLTREVSTAEEEWDEAPAAESLPVVGTEASRGVAARAVTALEAMKQVLHELEHELGRMDEVAGGGDHGRGMVRGIDHAVTAARRAQEEGWGAAGVLAAAGDAWSDKAGGTSGVLWGVSLRAFGATLGNEDAGDGHTVAHAVGAFVEAMAELGKAELGDKTILDAAIPFSDALLSGMEEGRRLSEAWAEAAKVATAAAEETSALRPRKGRARPLAGRSVGHPDPGAVSFASCVAAIGETFQ